MDTFYYMIIIICFIKSNFWTNSTFKSILKALKHANFGLKAGLLSRAQQAMQRVRHGRQGGVARSRRGWRQTKTNDNKL